MPSAEVSDSPVPASSTATSNATTTTTTTTPTTTNTDPVQKTEDIIDAATFEQILEMDDDEDREFSRAIVEGFLEQAVETFEKLDTALEEKDLEELSSLGHFLKGSSATLGLIKVKESCEHIQNYGSKKDETGQEVEDDEECLEKIKESLAQMRKDFDRVKEHFEKLYPGLE